MKKYSTPLLTGFLVLLTIPAFLNLTRAGIYVSYRRGDHRVFWIGPIGTTLPYLAMGFVAFIGVRLRRAQQKSLAPPVCAFLAGWTAMMLFTLWILSLPKRPELVRSSTIGIAVALTPVVYMFVFPVPYIVAYLACARLSSRKRKTREATGQSGASDR